MEKKNGEKSRGEGGADVCKHGKWIELMRYDGLYYFADSVFTHPRK